MFLTLALILVLGLSLAAYCYYKKGAPCGPVWLRNRATRGRERHTGLVPVIRYDAPRGTLVTEEVVELAPTRRPTNV